MWKPFCLILQIFASFQVNLFYISHITNQINRLGPSFLELSKGKSHFCPCYAVTKAYKEATNLSRNVKPSVESRKQL